MARTNINVGTSANDGTGDTLRDAFIAVNAMTTEIYGDNFVTNAMLQDDVVDSAEIADGAIDTVHIGDDQVTNDKLADDAVDSNQIADGAIDNVHLADDVVDHDELAARYTAKTEISNTTGTIDLVTSSFAIFELTGNLGTVTLHIEDMKKGQVIDILLTGSDLSSAVITITDDFATSQINKVGSTSLDTSKKNIIQVLCADDNDGAAILNYAIATYEADDNPD